MLRERTKAHKLTHIDLSDTGIDTVADLRIRLYLKMFCRATECLSRNLVVLTVGSGVREIDVSSSSVVASNYVFYKPRKVWVNSTLLMKESWDWVEGNWDQSTIAAGAPKYWSWIEPYTVRFERATGGAYTGFISGLVEMPDLTADADTMPFADQVCDIALAYCAAALASGAPSDGLGLEILKGFDEAAYMAGSAFLARNRAGHFGSFRRGDP